MKKNRIFNFIEQVKQESAKITWADKKEVLTYSSIVFFVVIITSLFFLFIDILTHNIIQMILNF